MAITWPIRGFNNSYSNIGRPILQSIAIMIFMIGRPSKNLKVNMSWRLPRSIGKSWFCLYILFGCCSVILELEKKKQNVKKAKNNWKNAQ
jgi:hypothetical protein